MLILHQTISTINTRAKMITISRLAVKSHLCPYKAQYIRKGKERSIRMDQRFTQLFWELLNFRIKETKSG